ncbi:alpha-tocopherol transfer protein-like [Thrips palmi]|uniref:Alpha-tocopherol transfer protein-like n=1 Tax=Thrips palmi TaxID=161013 RepID=A0A6P8YR48_THRPL|nr:alpha-tocopherol transfer protein-like [Thrips palmi]
MSKPRVVNVDDELEKNPKIKREHLDQFRSWVQKQPHLPEVPDQQLLLFLACSDCLMERAKATLEAHYTIKTHAPEFFAHRDPMGTEIQNILNLVEMAILPEPDKHGNRIFIGRLSNPDPTHYNFTAAVKAMQLIIETSLREEGIAPGYVFVYDQKGVQMGHVVRMPVSSVRKYLHYIQEGLAIKMKAIHVINMNPVGERFLNVLKPFMKKDLFNMLNFYSGNYDALYEHIPKTSLPRDYGGSQDTMLTLHHLQQSKVQAHRDWFLKETSLRVDESRRPGKAQNAGSVFGMEGSFKKLELD